MRRLANQTFTGGIDISEDEQATIRLAEPFAARAPTSTAVGCSSTSEIVVPSDADEKKWQTALASAKSVLSGATAPWTAPDYEPKRPIRQEQKRLKKPEVETLITDYRGGMSTYQLAAKWKLNRHTISAILDREGVIRRSYAARLSEAEVTEAEALHAEGWSMNALAKRYGVDPKTMKNRLASV